MTDNQIDTAQFREGLHRWCVERHEYGHGSDSTGDPCMTCGTILLLCDAIDALRADLAAMTNQRDKAAALLVQGEHVICDATVSRLTERALQVEAEVARLTAAVSASWDACSRPGGCIPGRPW